MYVVTALIEYLTVLLEYINLLGALAEWGPGQNAPVASPPLGGPECSVPYAYLYYMRMVHTIYA